MREDSDVNLFFDHPEGSLGLRVAMEVKAGSPPVPFGTKTDIVTRRSLQPALRDRIQVSALHVSYDCNIERS
jgi:hypothetical protein